MRFGLVLRRAGLPAGPADTQAALHALDAIDIGDRCQFRAALRATLTHRRDDQPVFKAAFTAFWRGPADGTPEAGEPVTQAASPGARRVAEATASTAPKQAEPRHPQQSQASSPAQVVRAMDFAAMGEAEITAARRAIARLKLPNDVRRTRRRRPDPAGRRVELAATIGRALRDGGEITDFARSTARRAPPKLVVLCDISGSMSAYAPMFLLFLHTLATHRPYVSVFLFGTSLTNVTRQLRGRDPEAALLAMGGAVHDWSGGTRIAAALGTFNRDWGRRLLGQGATVLLLTDGLDRAGPEGQAALESEMARLHRTCRHLIWLNPLLRYDGFEPRAASIRAMLPHVDFFRSAHNIASLESLAALLSTRTERPA
jgi:uncharacterized protein with von Willebrand factor type A (vWA) domain